MENVYHLLNGDALKEQFPAAIEGEKLIFRECLVDGPVGAETAEAFYEERMQFLKEHYGAKGKEEYVHLFLSQMNRLDQLPHTTPLYLWFEADLFCQVNLWYCLHRLKKNNKTAGLYVVMPPDYSPFSFGALQEQELRECYEKAIPITKIEAWAHLWEAYQTNNTSKMVQVAEGLQQEYPFVYAAVQAQLERIPSKNNLGRPLERLKAIQKEWNTQDFGVIFREFHKTEAPYGFGDLTVKRLWKEVQEKI